MFYDQIFVVRKLNAPSSEAVNRVVVKIEQLAKHYNCTVIQEKEKCATNTLVIAVGGDGTMLEAMRIAADAGATALGVNLGHVGFLTDFSEDEPNSLTSILYDIFERDFRDVYVEERVMVTARAQDQSWTVTAGNEITVSRDKSDATLYYHLHVNKVDAGIHRANSIIVATPTGSTAYSLSAGGSLMMPDMKALQIVPVAPMTMTSRPIIVGQFTKIQIAAWGGDLAIRADGVERIVYEKQFTKDHPCVIEVTCSPRTVRVLHHDSWNFFDVLTDKLGWIKE